jgi:flagellar hook-associated protein 3 FlgL
MRVDPNYIQNLSTAIDASTATEQQLTSELSSGLRVATLSSDPVAVSQNVGLSSSIAQIDSFTQSANSTQGRLQVADSALGEVVTQVTSAISVATGAGDGTLSAADLQSAAQTLTQLRNSVVALANTSYQGQYLFGGSQGNVAPFSVNTTTSPATTTYAGDAKTQTTTTPDGQQLQTSLAGSSVFTATGSSLLAALNQVIADLSTGSAANIAQDTSALSAALSTVSTQRSVLGSSLSRLNDASSYAATQEMTLKAQQSSLLSADTAQVATELSTATTQHQAILSTFSALTQTNLFAVLYK